MKISTKDWKNYISKLSKLSNTAANKMEEYVRKNGFADTDALTEYAYALVTKYGEGSAELACQMYDAIAEMQGVNVESAVPAETASYAETSKAINGSLLQSETGQKLNQVVGRLVKQAGADTTLKNAKRDGAYFAWVPVGDTCPYCLMLGAIGWQRAGKTTLNGKHAKHIHSNCDCQYVVDFKGDMKVSGYDNIQEQKKILEAAEIDTSDLTETEIQSAFDDLLRVNGRKSTKGERNVINILRRKNYAENKDIINAQKREAYSKRKALLGENVHLKTGNMTPKEYVESKNLLLSFNPVNLAQAVPTARKEANIWILNISEKAKELINRYTYNQNDNNPKFYERINSFIRNGYKGERDYTEQVNIISSALKQSKLQNDYKCFRGSDFNPFEGMGIGETATARQFLSTSLTQNGSFVGKYNIIVYAQKGTNAAYIEELSDIAFKKQREMLFDKDVVYEVLYNQGNTVIVRTKP